MLQLANDFLVLPGVAIPVRIRAERTRQIDQASIGIRGQPAIPYPGTTFLSGKRQAQGRRRQQVGLDNAITQPFFVVVAINETVLVIPGGDNTPTDAAVCTQRASYICFEPGVVPASQGCLYMTAKVGFGRFPDQVNGAGKSAGALQNAGRSTLHLDPFIHGQVKLLVAGQWVTRWRAIILHVHRTATGVVLPMIGCIADRLGAGHLGHGIPERDHVLVIHLAATENRNRIRNIPRTQGQLAGHGDFFRFIGCFSISTDDKRWQGFRW